MHGRFRLLALAAVGLVVATSAALVVSRLQLGPVPGVPIAVQEVPTATTPPDEPPATEESTPTSKPSTPTATTLSGPSTTASGAPVTVAKRKTITTPPSCSTLITGTEIARLTGASATPEPSDKGYCGFDLAKGGSPAGVTMIVLTPSTDSQGAELTTFEGNTAYRTTTAMTTCDLRIALTDDQRAPFRALWVTLVLNTSTESTCPTVDKLAKIVFDKLPDG
jgi:hypothetical protein